MVCYELCGMLEDRFEGGHGTKFIWEPVPDLCTPDHRVEMFVPRVLVSV